MAGSSAKLGPPAIGVLSHPLLFWLGGFPYQNKLQEIVGKFHDCHHPIFS